MDIKTGLKAISSPPPLVLEYLEAGRCATHDTTQIDYKHYSGFSFQVMQPTKTRPTEAAKPNHQLLEFGLQCLWCPKFAFPS